jgi:hypothetical protein
MKNMMNTVDLVLVVVKHYGQIVENVVIYSMLRE